jgi:hypothetical protein
MILHGQWVGTFSLNWVKGSPEAPPVMDVEAGVTILFRSTPTSNVSDALARVSSSNALPVKGRIRLATDAAESDGSE